MYFEYIHQPKRYDLEKIRNTEGNLVTEEIDKAGHAFIEGI